MFLIITESAQNCIPINFGSDSIVCKCNSTYCDFYNDPEPAKKGEFIWYVTSKRGMRLHHSNGSIYQESNDKFNIFINAKKKYQSVIGFGGAFTDSAGLNVKKLSQASQDNLLRLNFF